MLTFSQGFALAMMLVSVLMILFTIYLTRRVTVMARGNQQVRRAVTILWLICFFFTARVALNVTIEFVPHPHTALTLSLSVAMAISTGLLGLLTLVSFLHSRRSIHNAYDLGSEPSKLPTESTKQP